MGEVTWTGGSVFALVCLRRGQRLEESLEYQQFVANVEEEEAWINEKLNLVGSEDYGDTLAAVQVRQGHCFHGQSKPPPCWSKSRPPFLTDVW